MRLKIIADRELYCYLHPWEKILKPPEFSIRDLTENNLFILYSYNLIDNEYSRNSYTSNEPNYISIFKTPGFITNSIFIGKLFYFIPALHRIPLAQEIFRIPLQCRSISIRKDERWYRGQEQSGGLCS